MDESCYNQKYDQNNFTKHFQSTVSFFFFFSEKMHLSLPQSDQKEAKFSKSRKEIH